MAAIIKLSQNEWVMFFVQDGWNQVGRIQDGCHHQVQWEWMSLSQNELVWVRVRVEGDVFEWIWEKKTRCLNSTMQKLNQRWWNSRWPPSSSWVRMNEWSFLVQDGWYQVGRIQDGCNHQVQCEWMSEGFLCQMVGTNLGKCEWVWEEKLRWLIPRWPNLRWQNSRWPPSSS